MAAQPLPEPLPAPQTAVWNGGLLEAVVTFSGNLTTDLSLAVSNWKVRQKNKDYPPTSVSASANQVTVRVSSSYLPETGPSIVSYYATPADLLAADGRPVAAFSDFPLT